VDSIPALFKEHLNSEIKHEYKNQRLLEEYKFESLLNTSIVKPPAIVKYGNNNDA
jgi:hypothetical protein